MRKKIRQAAAAFAACAALLFSAQGSAAFQSASATMRGVIFDPAGAVVSGASVKATHVATHAAREAVTDDDGAYTFANLAPGEYEVRVERDGFKAMLHAGVVLQVGQRLTLDSRLEVAGIEV